MKTTKKEFEIFKKEFLKYVEIFGLKEYEVAFFHGLPDNVKDAYACLNADTDGMVANVYMATEVRDRQFPDKFRPKYTARHECIHLLIALITDLAKTRFIRPGELDEENERLVRRLEKVLS